MTKLALITTLDDFGGGQIDNSLPGWRPPGYVSGGPVLPPGYVSGGPVLPPGHVSGGPVYPPAHVGGGPVMPPGHVSGGPIWIPIFPGDPTKPSPEPPPNAAQLPVHIAVGAKFVIICTIFGYVLVPDGPSVAPPIAPTPEPKK
jgi:hypothetical protein